MKAAGGRRSRGWLARLVPWALAAACFALAFRRISLAAAAQGLTSGDYLARFFGDVNWWAWLPLMGFYSAAFVTIDAFATSRAIRWFHAPVRFLDILPIRASSYILALVNEQVGKGAIALYLNRRHRVPGWEVASTMVFIAFTELYTLIAFSSVGLGIDFEPLRKASTLLPLDRLLPLVFAGAALYLPLHLLYFSGRLRPDSPARERPWLHAFRHARPRHYVLLGACKAPNLLLAVWVYGLALRLFGVEVDFGRLLAFLPVIFLAAALPLPFHAGALALWTVLFPDFPQVAAFSLVMHSAFVLLNAAIGLLFLPHVNRELRASGASPAEPDPRSMRAS